MITIETMMSHLNLVEKENTMIQKQLEYNKNVIEQMINDIGVFFPQQTMLMADLDSAKNNMEFAEKEMHLLNFELEKIRNRLQS